MNLQNTIKGAWTACRNFLVSWWRWGLVSIIITIMVGLAVAIFYRIPGTGFAGYYTYDKKWQPAKTVWDWMDLCLIPLILAFGAALFTQMTNRREREKEDQRVKEQRELELDRSREAALQTYLDRMTELLKEGLRTSDEDAEERQIARVRTLTVLRQLDGERKGLLLHFLQEADLLGMRAIDKEAIVAIHGANLSESNLGWVYLRGAILTRSDLRRSNLRGAYLGDADLSRGDLRESDLRESYLRGADLRGADLRGADLCGADLRGADLRGADLHDVSLKEADLLKAGLLKVDLSGADLSRADLREADLREADLSKANLSGAYLMVADLSGANLSGANLSGANLGGAVVSAEQLAQVQTSKGAVMPDGTY